MDHTSINQIIIDIMVVFMVIGGIDRILGNRLNLGSQFLEGFQSFAPLALGMIGFYCLAPVVAKALSPVVVPMYMSIGADPSMFAPSFLAGSMGGYPIAQEMALTKEAAQFSGILLSSTMGTTIAFSIPVSFAMINPKNHHWLATGILCGIVTIPIGCFIGGVVAGFEFSMLLYNLVPIIILSTLIAVGLAFIPNKMIAGFNVFGRLMIAFGTIGIMAAIIEAQSGIALIPGMLPISDGISIVGSIVIVLAGAYPMVTVILKVFSKPMKAFGKILGINEVAAGGLITSFANSLPMLAHVDEMDAIGKTANFAFMVSGAFVLGDHLGFVAGVDKAMMVPMICTKLSGGILAIFLAIITAKRRLKKENQIVAQETAH